VDSLMHAVQVLQCTSNVRTEPGLEGGTGRLLRRMDQQ